MNSPLHILNGAKNDKSAQKLVEDEMTDINRSAKDVTNGLVDELLAVIAKYEGSMVVATALGCLEVVKAQLIRSHLDDEDDDDDY